MPEPQMIMLPHWASRLVMERIFRHDLAIGAVADAEHAAILCDASTLTAPDLGSDRHQRVSTSLTSIAELNAGRANLRIHATLLLREQAELIRQARAEFSLHRSLRSRDSVVLPGVRWECSTNLEQCTFTTKLVGAPEWLFTSDVIGRNFWLLPLDGSQSWQFLCPVRTAAHPLSSAASSQP